MAINDDGLAQLAKMCESLSAAEKQVEEAEKNLKAVKERVRAISEEDIPGLFSELGLGDGTVIALPTGEKVTVKGDVYAGITEEKKPAAFAWLEEHEFGGLIKSEITVAFDREKLPQAQELLQELDEREYAPEFSRSVHASTLKSFLREQLEKGAEIPLELFGARPVKVAKITLPKVKNESPRSRYPR